LATLHDLRTLPVHRRRSGRRTRTAIAVGLLAGALLGTPTAIAAPGDGVGAAQSEYDATAAEVAAIQKEVTAAEEQLQRLTIVAEAASGEALAAQARLTTAQAEATATATVLAEARGAVTETQEAVATLGREAYMRNDDTYGDVAVLLDADSPTELLQQATTLELLGEERTEQLEQFRAVEAQEARADRAARSAVAERDQAARAARDAQAAADTQLAEAQKTFDGLAAEKAALDTRLREAEIRLLGLRGVPDPSAAWADQQAAEQAAGLLTSAAGAVAPTLGRVTSCYGSRWGAMHSGVDIAAPIGTPVHTPEAGVVLQAGPASGFGLAVAVQHGDGTITVYGHVNRYFVSVGQSVAAGQQIAEVGNRGQSTGPHLHFETHLGGLYVDRANPVPWLNARGISLGGGC
jgi:murein DD-endopeptidase MepM/ murein hydrolase activator NlpD